MTIHEPLIPVLRRQKQAEFKASQGYMVKLCLRQLLVISHCLINETHLMVCVCVCVSQRTASGCILQEASTLVIVRSFTFSSASGP